MREDIQKLRGLNKEIREELAQADERMSRVLPAHFQSHERELEQEFFLYQALRTQLLWQMAVEEKGLILTHLQGENPQNERIQQLNSGTETIRQLFTKLKAATAGYTPPEDGCPTYDGMRENLKHLDALYTGGAGIRDTVYQNITGGRA